MDNKQIKQIRKDLNLTQTQLAEKLGFSRQTISNIESGRRGAGKHFIRAIDNLIKESDDK